MDLLLVFYEYTVISTFLTKVDLKTENGNYGSLKMGKTTIINIHEVQFNCWEYQSSVENLSFFIILVFLFKDHEIELNDIYP